MTAVIVGLERLRIAPSLGRVIGPEDATTRITERELSVSDGIGLGDIFALFDGIRAVRAAQ
jgi:hypothetical protein